MKKLIIISILVIHLTPLVYSSGGAPPDPPAFVNGEFSGAVHNSPIFFNDSNKVTFLANITYFHNRSMTGVLNVDGTGQAEPENNQNFSWKLPVTNYYLGVNFQFWRTASLFLSLNIDSEENIKIAGGDIGLGLSLYITENLNGRLNLGINFQQINFNTLFEVTSQKGPYDYSVYTQEVTFTNTSRGVNPSVSITLNTGFGDWLVNPFFDVSYTNQKLFKLPDSYSSEVSGSTMIFTFTPGITYKVSGNLSVIAGTRFSKPLDLENRSPDLMYSGFAQLNIRLE